VAHGSDALTVVQRCRDGMILSGIYMFLIGSSLAESASALSPTVQLKAEVGTLLLEQGILKVGVIGLYLDDKLSAEIDLHLEGRQECSGSKLEKRCTTSFHGRSYGDLSEALRAIDAAANALNTGTALKRRFRMDVAPGCISPSWSEVTVVPDGTLAEFVLGEGDSSYPITTDADQLAAFRSALQRASDLRDHLRPQIDAFNRTPPDHSKPIEELPDVQLRASDVHLPFSGTTGSRYGFVLENDSKREISYRAGGQTPVDAAMACRPATASDFDSPPLGMADGQFHWVTVAPGKRQVFSVDNHDFFFDTLPYAARYPGGRCRLQLHLENSKEVLSTEFTP
jgi:hypothetical protein